MAAGAQAIIHEKIQGILLDIEYISIEEKSVIELFVKTKKGIEKFHDKKFHPYFYIKLDSVTEKKLSELKEKEFGANKIKILNAEEIKKENLDNAVKLSFKSTADLSEARHHVLELDFVKEKREYDIPFTKKYLIDKDLEPNGEIEIELESEKEIEEKKENEAKEKFIKSVKKIESKKKPKYRLAAFDLETYSPGRFSDPFQDPILMISFYSEKEKKVLTWKKTKASKTEVYETEKQMIEAFIELIKKSDLDGVITYNGDLFDFPYLIDRTKTLGIKFNIDFNEKPPRKQRKGLENAVKLNGLQHIDCYKLMQLLTRFQVINLLKYDLESVAQQIFGKEKEKLQSKKINEIWDSGREFQRLVDYNLEDSEATYKLAMKYFTVFIEIGKLTRQTLYEVNRTSASVLNENLLLLEARKRNIVIPNKPEESAVKERMLQEINKGGYVKEPLPGLHENIAVLDFRSLYPSIMVSHNVSPEVLDCEHKTCEAGKNLSPNKHWFCSKRKGFISSVVEEVFNERVQLKKELKKAVKETDEYDVLYAKQYALKIILNSFYGNVGSPRFRWYSRESAAAITSWARYYIQETGKKAEQAGFQLLYTDTDSAFLIIPKNKKQEDILEYMKKINSELPGNMELELEGFYKRGIFVTKKSGGAAKKRYALIDFKNQMKIVGFEYVRRDWSQIAKQTQRTVLELILKEGKKEEAVEFVRQKIKELKSGKVPKKDLVILTQIKKSLKSYEITGPHVEAAKKAIKRGKEIGVGSVIGFIITKGNKKKISDRAELEEFVKEGEYDPDYYIEHQLIPAIIKIIGEFGLTEQDLKEGGKQSSLGAFS